VHPDGYRTAEELVAGIRNRADSDELEISVGAYPEVHPKAASADADMDNLKRKLDAGADRAITQYFFDADTYLRFVDRARAAGINAPIVPGIMPVTNFAGVCRFSERCGTHIPGWMHELFAGLDEAPEIRELVAATLAAEMCKRLVEHGVRDFHFYTMNKPNLTAATCRILGISPVRNACSEAKVS
jgi:methylenetetrahydrofolate reductase (NADPH)